MSEYIPCMSSWVWVSSLRIVFSSSILPACFKMSLFLPLSSAPLCYVPHFLYLFCSWGHLGCFQVVVIKNSATVHIAEHISFGMSVYPLGVCPRVVLLSLEVDWFQIFWETVILISKMAVQVYIPTSNGEMFPLLLALSTMSCHQCFWS